MKKILTVLLALAVCGAAWAAQDTEISEREVRDPRQLKEWLEANATDAEARLAAGGSVADTLALINAAEAGTAQITLQADKADDAGDKFGIVASDGGGLLIQSDATSKGTLATKATFSTIGGLTLADGLTITDASGHAVVTATAASGAYDASIILDADAGEDNADTWTVRSTASDNDLDFLNHTTVAMSLSSAGILTLADDLVTTDDVTVGDNLTVTDDAAIGGDATVAGTLAVTGVATFTAESVHDLGIDADYITVDAGYGIDTKSSGTLMVGAATANKIEISVAGIETEIQGTLDVHQTAALVGVATFTAMPVFNGGVDINEDIDIDFDAADEEIVITTSVNPDSAAGAGMVTLYDSEDANGANSAYMLRIARKNDGGANNEFILCQDNSTGAAGNGDTKFAVDDAGNTTVAGTLGVTGAGTFGAAMIYTPGALTGAGGIVTQTVANAIYTFAYSAVSTQRLAAATSGTVCTFVNLAATNVVLDVTQGDVTLGQYDAATVGYIGTSWITLSTKDN